MGAETDKKAREIKRLDTYMHIQSINFRENPTDGTVTGTNQYAKGIEMTKQPQTQLWTRRYQIKHLCWIQQLLEASQKFDALIVTGFRINWGKRKERNWIVFPLFDWHTRNLPKTRSGENEPCGFTTSHASSIPTEWREVGGTTDTLPCPSGHLTSTLGLHCVWMVARHHKHLQSCNRSTEPHVLSQCKHFADTGRFPSIHWCGMIKLPSGSSIISFPTLAKVVHLQFDIALAAQRLCTLNLQTSHERPWEVTPDKASRHT